MAIIAKVFEVFFSGTIIGINMMKEIVGDLKKMKKAK